MKVFSVAASILALVVGAQAADAQGRARVKHTPAPARPVYVSPQVHVHGGYYGPYYGPYYAPGYYAPAPPPAAAVRTYTRPSTFYMGLGIVGTSILEQSGGPEELEGGGGVSLWAGLHLNQALSLELGWLGSFHNPTGIGTWYGDDTDYLVLEGVTADARLHLSRGGGFDPYLQGGVGVYFLGSENFGMDSIGTGFQLGGGFDIWVGNAVTLGLRARYHGIAMGPPDGGDNDTFINAATVEGSIALHF
jgi:opacity protein-like surface antigen